MNQFIINNEIVHNQTLVDLINLRDEGQLLIPVYCRSKDLLFTIPEIKNIGLDYSIGSFKVCFGGTVTKYGKNPFRMEFLQYLFDSTYDVFELYNEDLYTTMSYLLLETGMLDTTFIPEEFKPITDYINKMYKMIDDHCKEKYHILMNQLLES